MWFHRLPASSKKIQKSFEGSKAKQLPITLTKTSSTYSFRSSTWRSSMINPKVAGFESKERLRSSEIKEELRPTNTSSGSSRFHVFGVVGLRRVDDEQAGSPDELFGRCEEVVFGVVGLRRVDDEQAGSPDELFGRCEKVVFGVVGLRRVDDDQAGSPEMSSVACSSEIKEDGLCFVLRVSEELYLNIYWILNIIWIGIIYIYIFFFRASNAY